MCWNVSFGRVLETDLACRKVLESPYLRKGVLESVQKHKMSRQHGFGRSISVTHWGVGITFSSVSAGLCRNVNWRTKNCRNCAFLREGCG